MLIIDNMPTHLNTK